MRRYEHVVNTKLLILSYYVMLFIWRAHWRYIFDNRETKRHLEIETLRTQRFVKTASNKRLRAEIENEATSSQSSSQQSQSSYEPNTDTSEDEIDDLKPTKLATNENGHAEEIVLEHMGNDNLRVCCKVLYNLLQTYTRKVNLQAVDESMYITLSINPFIDVFFDYNCDLSKAV
ncbi:hypothetical protein RO3G_03030 [Rhizopus delemar RA 99-880]|uniref:Uncharacterized protein n=1 Tax=Rhizopus delemar (strain RA 99-880 / ATCC MYA-4621 / FGSC 9543 / NRRL 43880) TaxID=246409 RepID=I1BQ46_RHIO9|nr:hypothetical protein RO3G_03030 [Rhizopus delemar RA 99-880]|eukprot:EIE78326.1 hypothetical protein RO3G_03030 [Rhizopus delemar RA 99-880]